MKKRIAFLVSLCLAFSVGRAQDASEDLGAAKELRILYAGDSGGEREQGFLELLRPWFATVDSIPIRELSQESARAYDVVVADWRRRFSAEGGFDSESSIPLQLGFDFDKPIIMIASVGGQIPAESKITWL